MPAVCQYRFSICENVKSDDLIINFIMGFDMVQRDKRISRPSGDYILNFLIDNAPWYGYSVKAW